MIRLVTPDCSRFETRSENKKGSIWDVEVKSGEVREQLNLIGHQHVTIGVKYEFLS
jgi:hypothetical protein